MKAKRLGISFLLPFVTLTATLAAACGTPDDTKGGSPGEGADCGASACAAGQFCVTETKDKGATVRGNSCQDLPAECKGTPSCACLMTSCGGGTMPTACAGVDASFDVKCESQ